MKIRIYAFLLLGVALLLVLTVLPFQSRTMDYTVPKSEMLLDGESQMESGNDIVVVCTTISPVSEEEAEVTSDDNGLKAEEFVLGSENTDNTISDRASEEKKSENLKSPGGAYPESHIFDQTEVQNRPQDVAITTDDETNLPKVEEFFTEEFLNQSPMVSKKSHEATFFKVSNVVGLDIIPQISGINGRSIFGLRQHYIEDGDTLEKLAQRYLGDVNRSNEIFEQNRQTLTAPDELPIGAVLLIPDRF